MYLLGYDIGSSTIKAALVHMDTNATVDVVQYPDNSMDMISRKSGWAEQQPEVWWQDFCFATGKLLQRNHLSADLIKGIGISYQMHGLVLIDRDQQVLRPAIIWCDSRAVPIGKQAFHELGEEYCLENLLNSPGNFTASKLKWVKDNEPDIYQRIHKILLPGDFIAMKLTGEVSTTIPGLSEGILWDFKKKGLADSVLNYYQIDEDLLPPIVPTFSVQGTVTSHASERTGLAVGTPITYRAGDQPNNALSLNVLKPGEIAATSGTSGVVYGIVDRPIYDGKSRVNAFAHVNYEDNYDRIGVLLCINGAGIQYSWVKHQISLPDRSYSDMERMANSVPVGSDGLCILPFGNGSERILENKNLNAHIFDLEFNRHTRGHLYRAALEGVAFSFVYGINLLQEMGLNVDVMRVGNDNMFQSEVFSTTIATLLDCQIEVVDTTGAIGAAQASGVANGTYNSLEEALSNVQPSIVYEPVLNQSQCAQAYNYWLSCLNKSLGDGPSHHQRSEALKVKYHSLQEQLEIKNKELASTTMHLLSKNDFLMEIKSDLKSIVMDGGEGKVVRQLERVAQKIENKIHGKRDWESFEKHFDLLHSEFFKKLKSTYPNLTMSEIKLCALLKMKMTTKEIAKQLNLSVRGVETRRYRLRKKLALEKATSFEDYLEHF